MEQADMTLDCQTYEEQETLTKYLHKKINIF